MTTVFSCSLFTLVPPFLIPRMSIELTDYVTMEEMLVAIQRLSLKGGSLKTGSALVFAAHAMSRLDTLREDAAKVSDLP